MRRQLVLAAAAATVALPAASVGAATSYPESTDLSVTNLRATDPQSGLTPCSTRYEQVAHPVPDASKAIDQAIKDAFNPSQSWALGETLAVVGDAEASPMDEADQPVIRVKFPQNPAGTADAVGPHGSGGFLAPLFGNGAEKACLHYKVRYPDTFGWTTGGRLPGLYGGSVTTGAHEQRAGGFTLRAAWLRDGRGELVQYIANGGIGARYEMAVGSGRWTWEAGRWHTVEQEVVLNEPGMPDGIARIWIDGRPMAAESDIVYRQSEDTKVDGLLFEVVFDDRQTNVSTPGSEHVDVTDIRLYSGGSGGQSAEEPKAQGAGSDG
ncbi:polysaccharide lyase [Caenispirillum salinarum]|uniref:polysaccharide lyase n=1 Tax=Caenispirillum salinarum TaxID=859058 RepID=UPI00384B50FB